MFEYYISVPIVEKITSEDKIKITGNVNNFFTRSTSLFREPRSSPGN